VNSLKDKGGKSTRHHPGGGGKSRNGGSGGETWNETPTSPGNNSKIQGGGRVAKWGKKKGECDDYRDFMDLTLWCADPNFPNTVQSRERPEVGLGEGAFWVREGNIPKILRYQIS